MPPCTVIRAPGALDHARRQFVLTIKFRQPSALSEWLTAPVVSEPRATEYVGPFSPGQGRDLVKSGAIAGGFMWNPAEAGRVFVTMGKLLLDGTEITEGTEIEGLGKVSPDAANKDIITDNLIAINADTVDELADLGL